MYGCIALHCDGREWFPNPAGSPALIASLTKCISRIDWPRRLKPITIAPWPHIQILRANSFFRTQPSRTTKKKAAATSKSRTNYFTSAQTLLMSEASRLWIVVSKSFGAFVASTKKKSTASFAMVFSRAWWPAGRRNSPCTHQRHSFRSLRSTNSNACNTAGRCCRAR